MLFKEFGDKNKPVILLLHGGGLSWWSWENQIETLQNDYHVVTPIIDGHSEDHQTTFTSIEASANRIIQYIKDSHNGRVYAICGLSIGAQITVEVLSRESDITEYAVIESALVYPMRVTTACMTPMNSLCYGLLKKRWFAKLQAKTLNVPMEAFERYYEDSRKMTRKSLINLTRSNGNYSLPDNFHLTGSKILIIAGERELGIMKRSAKLLHETIKESSLEIIEGYSHGEISLNHPLKYITMILDFFTVKHKIDKHSIKL